MTLNALVPYFGCKRQTADRIIKALGPHTAYVEPFCGSMAVLLAKPVCRMELVNDLSGGITNLARVVQNDDLAVRLHDRLLRTLFCEGLYNDSIATLRSGVVDLEWAYHYFVISWMGRNGFVGTTKELDSGFCVRHTSGGGDPATRFHHAVKSVPEWWERLRNVTILSRDGISLCDKIEDRHGTVIYVDPPYLDKSASYVHDFDQEHHQHLADSLRRFQETRVVVSYYEHPRLEDLYLRHDWSMLRLDVQKNLTVEYSPRKKAPEVLLINREAI